MNKNIYILWLQGFDNAPDVIRLCQRSWTVHNPTWTVHLVDESNLMNYIDLDSLIPGIREKDITFTSLSNVIRLGILNKHGGLWVDATSFCTRPLDSWLDIYIRHGFFALEDNQDAELPLGSWFIYADSQNYMIQKWLDGVVIYCKKADKIGKVYDNTALTHKYWRILETRYTNRHYFWFEYIFGDAIDSDAKFRSIWYEVRTNCKIKTYDVHELVYKFANEIDKKTKNRIDKKFEPVYKFWSPAKYRYRYGQNKVFDYFRISIPHRTRILYSHKDNPDRRQNLKIFLDKIDLTRENTLYYVITKDIGDIELPDEITVIRSDARSDFGAWGEGITHLDLLSTLNPDDRVILSTSVTRGPFVKDDLLCDWIQRLELLITPDTRLGGISINCLNSSPRFPGAYDEINCHTIVPRPYIPHVQSLLYVTDLTGIQIGMINGIFDDAKDLDTQIIHSELRFSIEMLRNNFNIDCILLGYSGHEHRTLCDNRNLTHRLATFGDAWINRSIDPYDAIFIRTDRAQYHHVVSMEYQGTGLCNQLIMIIHAILEARNRGNRSLIMSNFRTEIDESNHNVPLGSIFDLDQMNRTIVAPRFKPIEDCRIEFKSATYGINKKRVPLPSNRLPIFCNHNINHILSDPVYGIAKNVELNFEVDGIPYIKTIQEHNSHLREPVHGNRTDLEKTYSKLYWYDTISEREFINIARGLRFSPKFYRIADEYLTDLNQELNVVHLRVEDDAIDHWFKFTTNQTVRTKEEFKDRICQMYIKYIYAMIPRNQTILILSHSSQNEVIDAIKDDYHLIFIDAKDRIREEFGTVGRELEAIVDYIAGQKCSNIFIGCHSLRNKEGSTFSWFLHHTMQNKMSVLFDLENIDTPVEIVMKNR
jgi:Capsular polysaccharide synthesis protein